MPDDVLQDLANAAGIAPSWEDVHGHPHNVAEPTLRAVLRALGYPADTPDDVRDSLARARAPSTILPPMLTAKIGEAVRLPLADGQVKLTLEDGRIFDRRIENGVILPVLEPGYHTLELGDAKTSLAVAPDRCTLLSDLIPGGRALALAVQLYALRRPGDAGIGDWQALAEFVSAAGAQGIQAVAISPVHAQFSADVKRFAPYAPSSRVAYNVMHSASDRVAGLNLEDDTSWQQRAGPLEQQQLVNWPEASSLRLERFRSLWASVRHSSNLQAEMAAFTANAGTGLKRHALFEALHAHFLSRNPPTWSWRDWPDAFRKVESSEVSAFARAHEGEIAFHLFLQFLANRGLSAAQAAAKHAGMAVGLIADLAVGTDGGGSHCWSRQEETLLGMTIGAPPDLFQANGQNWGLTAFSPKGLQEHGYQAFLEMLRSSLAHAGGVRIDHGMGLNRLWVVPEGASAKDGAYLQFPERDLLNLLALESSRHRAIVVAEDLGTVPHGFTERLSAAGIYGMRVLWFERDAGGGFNDPGRWTSQAAAMTTTHDLPTVAGWWHGTDNSWRAKLDPDFDISDAERSRSEDRTKLWSALNQSGAAHGLPPCPERTDDVVTAAVSHVTRSACELMILPVEDVLGLEEQPNLPNTTDEHPNWRRRLPDNAAHLLASDSARLRLTEAVKGRSR